MGRERWRRYGSGLKTTVGLSTAGLDLALAVGVGMVGGGYVDDKLGTSPWLAMLGLALGATAGFTNLYRLVRRISGGGMKTDLKGQDKE